MIKCVRWGWLWWQLDNVPIVNDGISDNMVSLIEPGTYGSIKKIDKSTNGFYVTMFTSGAYTLQ